MKRLLLVLLMMSLSSYMRAALSQEASPKPLIDTQVGKQMTATLEGTVIWEGQDLSNTNVSVYRDEALTELYVSGIPQQEAGKFLLRVAPGRYYLVAYVDVDRSGHFDTGDGLGIYGITNWVSTAQKQQLLEIRDGERIGGLEIPITARAGEVNGELKIVSISEYQNSEFQQFQSELRKVTSGCHGHLRVQRRVHDGAQALVLAYTDITWKYRAAMTRVSDSGEWTLNLPPGKYYLMAIIDNNHTNKLDAGDAFGFYGIDTPHSRNGRTSTSTARKPFLKNAHNKPQPILIAENRFTQNVDIAITHTYPSDTNRQNQTRVALTGTVSPMPTDSTDITARVEVYAQPTLVTPLASAETHPSGTFQLALPPGEYYFIANLDADKNGRYSEGDGVGGYGTLDMSMHPPTPFVLTESKSTDDRTVDILITARYDADGQLRPAPPGIETHIEHGSISGRLLADGKPVARTQGIISLSYTPDFQSPLPIPITLSEHGRYHIHVLPGRYYAMAVLDQNNDGTTGLTDNVGLYGTRFPVRGEPIAVTVLPGHTTSHIDIEMFATYIDEAGTLTEIMDGGRWEIRRRYGEPEDVFTINRNGQRNEEWKYWTKGLGFRWRTTGAGWEFIDAEQFQPSAAALSDAKPRKSQARFSQSLTQPRALWGSSIQKAETAQIEKPPDLHTIDGGNAPLNSTPEDFLRTDGIFTYFGYDGVLWSLTADTGITAIAAGTNPTVAADGTLLYEDIDGNLILHDSVSPDGRILLDARHLARDAAISPDANYVAYTQTGPTNRRLIVIQHLPSNQTFTVPSTALQSFNPAWNRDGSLLAYVTEGTIENPDTTAKRNIYAFDSLTKRIEPIVISPAQDAEPAWSPANPNQLAFTRTVEEEPSQIWLVMYSDTGIRTEQQLTQYGGRHPVWMPPAGRWILYENNGQLWSVDIQNPGTSETPLMHNGQIVFGQAPAISSTAGQ